MVKEILINHDGNILKTLVDDEDYPLLSRHTWFIRSTINPYAATNAPKMRGNLSLLPMHYFIMGTGTTVDHINGDTLDNRKENLRKATYQQNGWNSRKRMTTCTGKPPSSMYKGVMKSYCDGR